MAVNTDSRAWLQNQLDGPQVSCRSRGTIILSSNPTGSESD